MSLSVDYPEGPGADLSRISQYITVKAGEGELRTKLHDMFNVDYTPTLLHRFLASVPAMLRGEIQNPDDRHYQLIVTTNYDDALEQAFRAVHEEFDLVYYVSEGNDRGKCRHIAPDGSMRVIDLPNQDAVSPKTRTVIAKIHGAVDRNDGTHDSYVITEDHYIDYLTNSDITGLFPIEIAAKLMDPSTHFLFLGYALRDWNLRVILRRIWGSQEFKNKSWAVQHPVDEVEAASWQQRGEVELFDLPLHEYINNLHDALVTQPNEGI